MPRAGEYTNVHSSRKIAASCCSIASGCCRYTCNNQLQHSSHNAAGVVGRSHAKLARVAAPARAHAARSRVSMPGWSLS